MSFSLSRVSRLSSQCLCEDSWQSSGTICLPDINWTQASAFHLLSFFFVISTSALFYLTVSPPVLVLVFALPPGIHVYYLFFVFISGSNTLSLLVRLGVGKWAGSCTDKHRGAGANRGVFFFCPLLLVTPNPPLPSRFPSSLFLLTPSSSSSSPFPPSDLLNRPVFLHSWRETPLMCETGFISEFFTATSRNPHYIELYWL